MEITGVYIYYGWCRFEKNAIDTGPRRLPVQRHYFGYSLTPTCHKRTTGHCHTLQSLCSALSARTS